MEDCSHGNRKLCAGEILDPFFTGFSGQQFYFPAEAGEIYNLFIAKVTDGSKKVGMQEDLHKGAQ